MSSRKNERTLKTKVSSIQNKLLDVKAEAKVELDKAVEKHNALWNHKDTTEITVDAAKARSSKLEKDLELA